MNKKKSLIVVIVAAAFLVISAFGIRYASVKTAERKVNPQNSTSSINNTTSLSQIKELQVEKLYANKLKTYPSEGQVLAEGIKEPATSQGDDSVKVVEAAVQMQPASSTVTASKSTTAAKKPETPAKPPIVKEKPAVKIASRSASVVKSNKGISVVNTARQYLGLPYVYGAAGPSGFDCSGLTMYVYSKFGISLPHSADGQSHMGQYVPKSELQPGDLVFFATSSTGRASHTGIYTGGGNFIHAPEPGKTVTIDSMSSSYYSKRYITAKRFIN